MLFGSMCCTERLNLRGAVPVRQLDGGVGALSVATSSHSYTKEREIAIKSLEHFNFVIVDGVWTHQSMCHEKVDSLGKVDMDQSIERDL